MPRPEHGGRDEPRERGRSAEHSDADARDEPSGEGEEGGRRPRIDLSVAQVAGAGVATLTAATAASYLNVYGTVIGTAVMAVLSTSAAPVIQHWITRSGEQAKGLADKSRHPRSRSFVGRPEPATPVDVDDATVGFEAPTPFRDADDATRTMAMPSLGRDLPGQTLAHGFGNPADPTRPHDPITDEATELLPQVPHGEHTGASAAEDDDARPRRGPRTALITAGVVFTLVMLVILAFELLTGRSLTAWTQGQDEPTSPSLLGGQSAPAETQGEDDTGTPDEEPAQRDPGTDTTPDTDTDPVEPGTNPDDRDSDVPTRPTDPVDPPVEEPEPEQPEEPVEPGGEGDQGEVGPPGGAPQGVPPAGAQSGSVPTG
ncbi:hypothetical protein [Nocardiopsis sp. MG754419]|uniref:hypothetical protein n=1 Tax=Nocardiopsis sp. MG754419 TaxID=2259865 RepID=UPI001BA97074|nr:hypothetical protein [Nocardiopsis sp. MG754419]MBR8741779.1 hypothetical protein [Nocardiopsis sp. MG754419]